MGRVQYYECDKCQQRLTAEQESDGAISVSAGSTLGSLCLNCQKTTTVFESKEIARKMLEKWKQEAAQRAPLTPTTRTRPR